MKAKVRLNTKVDKVKFLLGIQNGMRSISELIELETVFTEPIQYQKALNDQRYDGETILFIPSNGRNRPSIENYNEIQ